MGSRKSSGRGFTLVELLIVVTIIGMLMAAVMVVAVGMIKKAKISGTVATMSRLKSVLDSYRQEFRYYPHGLDYTLANLGSLDQAGSMYLLWKGGGPDPAGSGAWTISFAPAFGKIKGPQRSLLDFIEEGKLDFGGASAKLWPVDKWGTRILYGIWQPPSTSVNVITSGFSAYFVLTSAGPDKTYGTVDDIVVKGQD